MEQVGDVEFIQGDFTDAQVADEIMATLNGAQVDLLLCDMAPNISGVSSADQAASVYLVDLALDMATQVLKPHGNFVTKVFQGEGHDDYLKTVRAVFDKVLIRKPDASRARSREVYLVAKGFKG